VHEVRSIVASARLQAMYVMYLTDYFLPVNGLQQSIGIRSHVVRLTSVVAVGWRDGIEDTRSLDFAIDKRIEDSLIHFFDGIKLYFLHSK